MQSGGSGGGLSSDINVTPMIDVLLVLLIIFMITLPLSGREFDVQVPPEQKNEPKQKQQQSDQIVLELARDGSYSINRQPVAFDQLDAKFHELYDQRPAKLLFIKAAPNRKYGDIVKAMDVARGAGVQVIGFTPREEPKAGGRESPGENRAGEHGNRAPTSVFVVYVLPVPQTPPPFSAYSLPVRRRPQGPAAALSLLAHLAIAVLLLWRGAALLEGGGGGTGPPRGCRG